MIKPPESSPTLLRELQFFAQVTQMSEHSATTGSATHWTLELTNNIGQHIRLNQISWPHP